jgi:hypothetical protein
LCLFEHAGCQNLEACIEHFHLHVISGEYDLGSSLAEFSSESVTIDHSRTVEASNSYLFCGRYAGNGVINGLLAQTDSKVDQFFRRALAKKLQQEVWDWRAGMNPDFMLRLMTEVRGSVG